MSYVKTNWVNDVTPVNEENMNHIEQGIANNSEDIETLNHNVETLTDGLQETNNQVVRIENNLDTVLMLKGTGEPTESTVGYLGQFYLDTNTSNLYQCKHIEQEGETIIYSWQAIGGGSVSVDNTTISKNSDDELQAIGLTDGENGLTFEEIYQAMTIERTV